MKSALQKQVIHEKCHGFQSAEPQNTDIRICNMDSQEYKNQFYARCLTESMVITSQRTFKDNVWKRNEKANKILSEKKMKGTTI